MKRLPLLETLTNILFILAIIGMAFSVPFLLMAIFMPEEVPMKINGTFASNMGPEEFILFTAQIIAFGFWSYALYLFKSVLKHFKKRQIFHESVISLLDQTGKAILIGFLINIASTFLYNTVINGEFSFGVTTESIFVLILGLFFMVLSEVFLMAKGLKEENDLTV